jgi:hypothetical protein
MLTTTGVDSFRENETLYRNFQGIPMFCAGKIPKTLKGTREMVLSTVVLWIRIRSEWHHFAGSGTACRAESMLFDIKTTVKRHKFGNGH